MMTRSVGKSGVRPNLRVFFLSSLSLFLTLPLLWQDHGTLPLSAPVYLAVVSTIFLITALITSVIEQSNLTRWLLILAVLALSASLFWTWQEVLANLVELGPRIIAIFAVTVLGHAVHVRLRSSSRIGFRASLGISALPVVLVCGCYLLLCAAGELTTTDAQELIAVGLAITYFNLGATIFSGGSPLDGGRVLGDGYRLLGDGKTWRGSLLGVFLAMMVSAVFFGSLIAGLFTGTVALLGDAGASFLKRRFRQEQSTPVPLLDQLDGLLPLLYVATFFQAPVRLVPGATPILLVGTIFIQFLGNRILFSLGKKNVPW